MPKETITSRFLDQNEKPNFRTLDELKRIFNSNPDIPTEFEQLNSWSSVGFYSDTVLRINISHSDVDFVDFRIMQLPLGTFLMTQPDEIREMLHNGQVSLLIETLSQDKKSKAEIVLLNVLETALDVELVASLPETILDCLFGAIIGELKENQAVIEQILQMPKDQLYEIAQMCKTYRTPPSEYFIPGVTCTLTRWIINSSITKISMKREGKEFPI